MSQTEPLETQTGTKRPFDINTFDFEAFLTKYKFVERYGKMVEEIGTDAIKEILIRDIVKAFSSPQNAYDFASESLHHDQIRIIELEPIIEQDKQLWEWYGIVDTNDTPWPPHE